ncbi:MAG: mannose-1-phosphate guanylyltransferase/mannose-6-phosphate isomerase [Paracoccaceae bacterium]
MKNPIYPVILCGGMGSRLWPMSRIDQPKQFQPISGKGSLTYFQTTVQRHRSASFHAPIVVTNARHTAMVDRQLHELQTGGTVIGEPVGRNTGPAVLAAALTALQSDPDAQLLVLPSDHIIKGNLNKTVTAMQAAADNGRIVTFGIKPAYPETGYGYITDGGGYENYPGLHRVESFVEKPAFEIAKRLLNTGFSYWASGISLFRADALIEEFHRLDPNTYFAVLAALKAADRNRDLILLEESSFAQATNEPTERLVFERTAAIALAPLRDIEWDDVGAWNAVHQISERNADGNVTNGDVLTMDTKNSMIQSDTRLVAVIGMQDVIVIDTPDALLVTNREHSQSVKKVVDHLKSQMRREVHTHVARDTTWGRVEKLAGDAGYDMRMITVQPGARLKVNGTGSGPSLLTVVSGEGIYEMDGVQTRTRRGDTVAIDADFALPLINPTSRELRVIQLMFTRAGDEADALLRAEFGAPLRGFISPDLTAFDDMPPTEDLLVN